MSTKVTAAAFGSAVATIIWTIVGALTSTFSTSTIALLTGATATVVTGLIGYFVPEKSATSASARPRAEA